MLAAVVVGCVLVVLALLVLGPDDGPGDEMAQGYAETACDLTSKAERAEQDARAEPGARLAAALLLDQAMVESERAAEADAGFADLDRAVRELHAAAHRTSSVPWQEALDAAQAGCRDALR